MIEINEDTVRAEVRAWLEANWNPDYGLVEWRLKLAESGWGVPHWPRHWYGHDLPVGLVPVVEEEFKRIGAIGVAKVGIRTLAAATILAHGTDLQKEKFLLRILTGEDIWCQLFSEPGSGSDLAGAVTRAEFRGNQWVVNGQKVWTTSAHKAHWGLLLARTDWDQRKHQGLSYFIMDMKQPGVTVQPLRQMNGYASFNQVFMTDAKVEPEFLVSEVGDGWAVTTTTLMHERRGADGLRSWAIASDKPGHAYDEEREEIRTTMEPYKWYPQRAGRVDLIMERARAIKSPEEISAIKLSFQGCADSIAVLRREWQAQQAMRLQTPARSMHELLRAMLERYDGRDLLDLVRSVARVGGGPAHVFYAPMILDDAQTAAAIRRQGDIAEAFALVPSR